MKKSLVNHPEPLQSEGPILASSLPYPLLNRRFTGWYRNLDSAFEEIRLISLLPGPADSKCRCELITAPLKECPSYRALSYAWGNVDDTREILLHNQPFKITASLEKALKRLRRFNSPIILWADAISINQASDEERNQQVRLMRAIYEHAKEVVIWLGEEQDLHRGRFWVPSCRPLILVGNSSDKKVVEWYSASLERSSRHNDGVAYAFCLLWILAEGCHFDENPFFTHEAIRTLNEILQHPWWTRIWVVQETVVATRATVLLGSVAASWSIFAKAAKNYELHSSSCCPAFNMEIDTADHTPIHTRDILDIQQSRVVWKRQSRTTLLPLIWQFRVRQSTDPRDKIYALLGLATRWGSCPAFEPDYSKQWTEVYKNFTLHMIAAFQSLDVLLAVSPSCSASWIPDWTRETAAKNPDRLHQLENYNASKTAAAQVELHGDILTTAAIRLNEIVEISPELPLGDTNRATAVRWYDPEIRKWFLPKRQGYETGPSGDTKSLQDFSWRLLCADSITKKSGSKVSRRAEVEDQELFDSWWLSIKALARTANTSRYGFNNDVGRFDHAVRTATGGRRFFRTLDWFYGLGPSDMELGDEVWIPLSSRTPFVTRKANNIDSLGPCDNCCLRLSGNKFVKINDSHLISPVNIHSLIGDCFYQGFMDGEAIDKLCLQVLYIV